MTATFIPPYMTVRQCAEEAQLTPQTIYAYIERGLLKAWRPPGGRGPIRIKTEDWRAFMDGSFGPGRYSGGPGGMGDTGPLEPVQPKAKPPKPVLVNGRIDAYALGRQRANANLSGNCR